MALKLEKHEQWDRIGTELRSGVPFRTIEEWSGVPSSNLHRAVERYGWTEERKLAEIKRDFPMEKKILIPSVDPKEVEKVDFLADLYRIRRDLMALQNGEDPRISLGALDKQIKLISTLVEVAKELREQRKDDLMSNPEFKRYEDAVVEVLNEFPGAVERLSEKLRVRRPFDEAVSQDIGN